MKELFQRISEKSDSLRKERKKGERKTDLDTIVGIRSICFMKTKILLSKLFSKVFSE